MLEGGHPALRRSLKSGRKDLREAPDDASIARGVANDPTVTDPEWPSRNSGLRDLAVGATRCCAKIAEAIPRLEDEDAPVPRD